MHPVARGGPIPSLLSSAAFLTALAAQATTPPQGSAPAPSSQSPHAWDEAHGLGRSAARSAAPPPPPDEPSPGPQVTVYGYWPYWGDDLQTIAWDQLSHLAIFNVDLQGDGSLDDQHHWTDHATEAVALGQKYGVKIHLTVTCFDDKTAADFFPSASRRSAAVAELAQLVEAYGADGVNIDVEGLNSEHKDQLTAFTQELSMAVDEVFLATPAIDWSGAYDYDALAAASDGLFIMAYGYHYSDGDPGPNSPLHGGDPWSDYAISWTVDDYRIYGAPDDKIIVGLPLYGRNWPTTDNSVPGEATDEGSSVTWVSAISQCESYGRLWDEVTSTPYCFPDSTHQLWYDDVQSLEDKIAWSVDQGLQGVGFWAVTYEDGDPALWELVDELTNWREPSDSGDSDQPGDSQPAGDSGAADDGPGAQQGLPPDHRGVDEGCGCGALAGRRAWLGLLALGGLLGLRRRR